MYETLVYTCVKVWFFSPLPFIQVLCCYMSYMGIEVSHAANAHNNLVMRDQRL